MRLPPQTGQRPASLLAQRVDRDRQQDLVAHLVAEVDLAALEADDVRIVVVRGVVVLVRPGRTSPSSARRGRRAPARGSARTSSPARRASCAAQQVVVAALREPPVQRQPVRRRAAPRDPGRRRQPLGRDGHVERQPVGTDLVDFKPHLSERAPSGAAERCVTIGGGPAESSTRGSRTVGPSRPRPAPDAARRRRYLLAAPAAAPPPNEQQRLQILVVEDQLTAQEPVDAAARARAARA